MTGLHELLETSFMRDMAAKAEAERIGQIAWFDALLESLNKGDIESCRQGIEGALELLNRGDSIQWSGDHGNGVRED